MQTGKRKAKLSLSSYKQARKEEAWLLALQKKIKFAGRNCSPGKASLVPKPPEEMLHPKMWLAPKFCRVLCAWGGLGALHTPKPGECAQSLPELLPGRTVPRHSSGLQCRGVSQPGPSAASVLAKIAKIDCLGAERCGPRQPPSGSWLAVEESRLLPSWLQPKLAPASGWERKNSSARGVVAGHEAPQPSPARCAGPGETSQPPP